MGARPPAAALIEQNHAEDAGVEIPPHRRAAPTPRTAMQNHHGNAMRIAALLDIKAMPVAHVDHALIERIDRRIKKLDCALLA
jgi:hypothetical protein